MFLFPYGFDGQKILIGAPIFYFSFLFPFRPQISSISKFLGCKALCKALKIQKLIIQSLWSQGAYTLVHKIIYKLECSLI